MVPPAQVPTNKIKFPRARLFLPFTLAWLLAAGCAPTGPDALLQGESLIHQGKFDEAIERLQTATRLLPKNAAAWNHLGLAYHGARQPDPALKAYRTALSLDHKLSAARYNLGCLYLEQTNTPSALEELTSYTLLQPAAPDGWLKLGTAQLRARRLDLAEKHFKAALELQPRHPEALNGLGLVQYQRRRAQEAFNYFNLAIVQNPNYGPALFNAAVVQHQALNNRAAALTRYQQYAALQPRRTDAALVDALARQLEAELNPPALRPPASNQIAQLLPKTNPPPASSNSPARLALNANPPAPAATSVRPNVAAPTNPPRVAAVTPPSNTIPVAIVTRPPVEPPKTPRPAGNTNPPIEITRVSDALVIQPPQDLTPASATLAPPRSTAMPPVADMAPTLGATTLQAAAESPRTPKKNLLERLNPFAGRAKKTDAPVATPAGTSGGPVILVAEKAAALPSAEAPPPRLSPRYAYLAPARPAPGDRAAAEKHFALGVQAHQAGQLAQARAEYAAATESDPSYYAPYYNRALAALDAGDLPQALAAYEHALAAQPEAKDARYGFALALKQGNYAQDAADELSKLVRDEPNEARAHLSLANLCAQQLAQPERAREHYLKLLELNPRHPDAPKIRYWLAANP